MGLRPFVKYKLEILLMKDDFWDMVSKEKPANKRHQSSSCPMILEKTSNWCILANHIQMAYLLGSNPYCYNSITTALAVRADSDLTQDLVKEKLIQEQKHRQEEDQL